MTDPSQTLRVLDTSASAESQPHQSRWALVQPNIVAHWFGEAPFPWWVAGGWAIDLFLARETRPHKDIDIGIFRKDVCRVVDFLSEWQVYEACSGELIEHERGTLPETEVHSLWCRRSSESLWELEILLDESKGSTWTYRRDQRVRRALDSIVQRSPDGLPILAPAVQLLYKSKAAREKDQLDFRHVLPKLAAEEREWLRASMAVAHPGHPWLDRLTVSSDA